MQPRKLLEAVKWSPEGLIPAIVQDAKNGDLLMMAWMNPESLRQTLATGQTHFYSRSRSKLWHKGGTSGHVQNVREIRVDCDGDVLLILVEQIGGACHEGYRSCFFRRIGPDGSLETIAEPIFDPKQTYGAGERPRTEPPART